MRTCVILTLALACTGPAVADESIPKLQLSDPGLPVWELRPLDRRVHCLSLEGTWNRPPTAGAVYEIDVRFRDGTTYTHRPLDDALFRKGEVRCLVQDYQLTRHKVARDGQFTVFVTERLPGGKSTRISNRLVIPWPLKRAVVRRLPHTKYSPPRPIDAFPLPDDEVPPLAPEKSAPTKPAPGKPAPKKLPPPKEELLPDK